MQARGKGGRNGWEVFGQVGRREQCIEVGTHRVEGHIAQVEQAGIAHHNVQAQGQHDVEQRKGQDANPGVAECARHKRQQQQGHANEQGGPNGLLSWGHARSATRSPSRPEGRKIKTRMSTANAKTSW